MNDTHPIPTLDFSKWIGRAYVPVVFDCWGFMRAFYALECGIDLPAVTTDPTNKRQTIRAFRTSPIRRAHFERVDAPEHLDAVEISFGNHPAHCGIYVVTPDGPRILHNLQGSGVVCEPPESLPATRITFWRPIHDR